MTEITRVPLQPVKKGALTKLWIAVALLLAAAAGVAWATMPEGFGVTTVRAGEGPTAQEGDVVFATYVGRLDDGTVFDQSQPLPPGIPEGMFPEGTPFPVQEGATIPGFFDGLKQVQAGGNYTFRIPADQAYGAEPPPGSPIPPDADLTFEIGVSEVMSQEEFQGRVAQLQQMMQQQQGVDGPGGAPDAPPAQ